MTNARDDQDDDWRNASEPAPAIPQLDGPGVVRPFHEELRFVDAPKLELDQLLEQLRDRATDVLAAQGRLRGLLRANSSIAGELTLPVVLRRIVATARDLLDSRYAALGVFGGDGELDQFVHSGMKQVADKLGGLPLGRETLAALMREPRPLRLEQLGDHPEAAAFPADQRPMGPLLGVPIQVGDEVFGNLFLIEREDDALFTLEDEDLAKALATTAGQAISNARLYTESEQRRRWLAAAGELTHRLLSSTTDDPMSMITQEAALAADADFATLALPHRDEEILVESVYGTAAAELLGHITPLEGSLVGRALRTGKPLLVSDFDGDTVAMPLTQRVTSVIVVPLTAGESVRGALTLARLDGRAAFSEADLSMATTFGNHAAIALELVEARHDQIQLAQLEDHDRIARDLHDHVIQEVFAVGIGLQGLAGIVKQPAISARIMGYVDSLDRVITQIRAAIFKLHLGPKYGTLETRLLGIAVQHTAQLGFTPRMEIAEQLEAAVTEQLADDIVAVTREALSNCARHAAASSAEVRVDLRDDTVVVEVVDDGRGIGTPERSSGLTNMRQRAERHGGGLEITSPPLGGTRLLWTAHTNS